MLWDPRQKPFNISKINAPNKFVFSIHQLRGTAKGRSAQTIKFMEQTKDKGVKVVAIATENSDTEWKKFIEEQHFAERY